MPRRRFLPVCLSSFALTVTLLAPGVVRAAEPLQVIRPGDREMSCQALAAEINMLAQPQPAAIAPRKKHGLGFLKVIGAAVPMVGLVGSLGGAALSSAAGAAQVAAAGDGPRNAGEELAAAKDDAMLTAVREQRKDRLTAVFDEKRC